MICVFIFNSYNSQSWRFTRCATTHLHNTPEQCVGKGGVWWVQTLPIENSNAPIKS